MLDPLGIPVHTLGEVPATESDPNVITVTVPYLALSVPIGDDDDVNPRYGGGPTRRTIPFQITYVGSDTNQAKWAGERSRAALSGRAFVLPGHRTWAIRGPISERVRPDPDAHTADGRRLFFGVDSYDTALTLQPA